MLTEAKKLLQNDDVKILKDLGLTTLQAKIYLSLAEIGEAAIKTIAKNADVARQNTYQILSELQDFGLIEKVLAKPLKFRALPVTNAANMLFQNKTAEYHRIEAQTKNLLQRTKDNKQEGFHLESGDQFVLIPEKEAHVHRIEEAYRNAQATVCTVMVSKGTEFLRDTQYLPPFLKKAVMRGINIRHLTNKPQDCASAPANLVWRKKGSYELRYIPEEPPAMFCLFDDREVFFATELTPYPQATASLWTNNSGLIALAKNYFERTWLKAENTNKNE